MADTQTFVDEYLKRRQSKIDTTNAAQALTAQQYLATSADPAALPSMYAADPTKLPKILPDVQMSSPIRRATGQLDMPLSQFNDEQLTKAGSQAAQYTAALRSKYTNFVETVWAENRDTIPVEWLLQWNSKDLELLAGAGGPLSREQVQQLVQVQHDKAVQAQYERTVNQQFERTKKQQTTRRNFVNFILQNGLHLPVEAQTKGEKTDEQLRLEAEKTVQGLRDTLYEGDIQKWKATMETNLQAGYQNDQGEWVHYWTPEEQKQMLAEQEASIRNQIKAGANVHDLLNGKGFIRQLIDGGLWVVGQGVKGAAWLGGATLDATVFTPAAGVMATVPGLHAVSTPREWLENHFEEAKQQRIDEINNHLGRDPKAQLAEAQGVQDQQLAALWQQLPQQDPAGYNEVLRMAGFDPLVAFSLWADAQRETPDAQQQLADYIKTLDEQDKNMIQQAQESDFRLSSTLMNGLAWYGNQVAFAATSLPLLIGDQDIWAAFNDGGVRDAWDKLHSEVDSYGRRPSEAMGIDGSLLGLTVDLGLTTMLDPTVWLFGARVGRGGTGAMTAADVERMSTGAMAQQSIDDVMMFSRSPSKGAGALMHHMDWMPAPLQSRLLHIVGYAEKLLPAEKWRKTWGASQAMEVRTDFLRRVAPEAGAAAPEELARLSQGLLKDGFKEYGTIEVSRLTGDIKLTDGAKRLAASENAGISHMPVQLKVVDSLPGEVVDPWLAKVASGKAAVATEGPNPAAVTNGLRSAQRWLDTKGIKMVSSSAEDIAGESFTFKVGLTTDGEARGVVLTRSGEIASYISTDEQLVVTANLYQGRGLATQLMDKMMAEYSDSFKAVASSKDISPAGATFNKSYALHLLEKNAPKGISLEDVVGTKGLFGRTDPLKPFGTGEVRIRPDQLIPREELLGAVDREAIQALYKQAMELGYYPNWGKETIITRALGAHLRDMLRTTPPGRWIERYMTKAFTQDRFELTGPNAVNRLHRLNMMLWGENTAKLDYWTEQLFRWQESVGARVEQGAKALQDLEPRADAINFIEDNFGRAWDDQLTMTLQAQKEGLIGEVGQTQLRQALENRSQMKSVLADMRKSYDKDFMDARQVANYMGDTDELANIVQRMYDDYAQTYFKKRWKDAFDKEGRFDYDVLKKGRKRERPDLEESVRVGRKRVFARETMADMADEIGANHERMAQTLMNNYNQAMAVNVPVDPLTMVMARETGGAAFTRLSHLKLLSGVRSTAFAINTIWVIDKVFRASTAMTVSFDELLRMWHLGGYKGFMRWMEDKGMYFKARVESLLHEGRFSVERGAKYLSPQSQERIRILAEYPTALKQAERQFYDANGLGWSDIPETAAEYYEQARRWTGGFLQDTGFRHYLQGRDAFREWFMSPDGQRLREAAVLARGEEATGWHTLLGNADQYYDGWNALFEDILLKKAKKNGTVAEVRQAWKDTAAKIDTSGGLAHEVPSVVLDNLGPVRGVRRYLPDKTGALQSMSDSFFQHLFMNPVNYRRGFLADLVRQSEESRLQRLFSDMGRRVVSDAEAEQLLGLRGLSGSTRVGAKYALQRQAMEEGLVTRSMLDDMIERAVENEIDNVLFTWDQGTRAGSQMRAVFPFARPWADMMGFWGRELLRRPVLRGKVNETNFLGLRSLNERGLIPFNPKTAGLFSRLANTQFTVDYGLTGGAIGPRKAGGLFPGSSSTSFTPLFFLPTGGENPFASLIPGLGILPTWAIDMYLDHIDPVANPDKYQQTLDAIGDYIPSIGYQAGGSLLHRTLGGGTIGALTNVVTDGLGLADASLLKDSPGVQSYFNLTSQIGDINREIASSRAISALLADPEELKVLMQAQTPEEVDLLIRSLTKRAEAQASGQDLARLATRWVVPATNHYDTTITDVMDVWVDAVQQFPELHVRPDLQNADLNDPQVRRQYANDVRNAFFDLPQWQRDLMIAQDPQLAVNLVSSWEWTPKAAAAEIPGWDTSYRTGGSTSDLIKHQYYVDNGFVRPVNEIERVYRILGMQQASKDSALKQTYTFAAQQVNDFLWNSVATEEDKTFMQQIADSPFGKKWNVQTPREVWDNWGSLESKFEEQYAKDNGIALDSDAFDELKKQIKVSVRSWGTSWPGLNPDQVSAQFGTVSFNNFGPDLSKEAAGLGIRLTKGMTGEQLYNEIQGKLTEVNSPLASMVKPSYDSYTSQRSSASDSALSTLMQTVNNQELSQAWRTKLQQFMNDADTISERYQDEIGGIPSSEQQKIVDEYNTLTMTTDLPQDWQGIWDNRYARTFGSLDWTPPEPRPPVGTDGKRDKNASTPQIINITDGDSMVVKLNPWDKNYTSVRLLGVRAPDFGSDNTGALQAKQDLQDALQRAVRNGDTIWLVRDPETFGTNTDHYGRVLAWLWIGDTPYYNPEDFRRQETPSGGGK